jgi:hypothetical protein
MTTHTGHFDWGAVRQDTDERIRRAEIDVLTATKALQHTEPDSPAYSIVAARYERAVARLAELEAG